LVCLLRLLCGCSFHCIQHLGGSTGSSFCGVCSLVFLGLFAILLCSSGGGGRGRSCRARGGGRVRRGGRSRSSCTLNLARWNNLPWSTRGSRRNDHIDGDWTRIGCGWGPHDCEWRLCSERLRVSDGACCIVVGHVLGRANGGCLGSEVLGTQVLKSSNVLLDTAGVGDVDSADRNSREGRVHDSSWSHVGKDTGEAHGATIRSGNSDGNSGTTWSVGGWELHHETEASLLNFVSSRDDGFSDFATRGAVWEGVGGGGEGKNRDALNELHA
ncbi:hypothetical protein BJ741DRAFT_673985, partial [Chytriomyces cf. hyalinus JEL632]